MDTVMMTRENNNIPSCHLIGLLRPSPLILASPLSTFYRSSPKDSPIIPETQVRLALVLVPTARYLFPTAHGRHGSVQLGALTCFPALQHR